MRIYDHVDRLDRVAQVDPAQLPELLSGPNIDGEPHIWKLHLGGSGKGRAMRPLLCRGPVDNNAEVTLLLGAEEKGGKLLPAGAARKAEGLRIEVRDDPQNRRCAHERLSWNTRS